MTFVIMVTESSPLFFKRTFRIHQIQISRVSFPSAICAFFDRLPAIFLAKEIIGPRSRKGKDLPRCSVIRPTSTQDGGAVATVKAFTEDGLFIGQTDEFLDLAMDLAVAADSVKRGF